LEGKRALVVFPSAFSLNNLKKVKGFQEQIMRDHTKLRAFELAEVVYL